MNDATCISNLCTKSRADWSANPPALPPGPGRRWVQDPTNKFRITIHHTGEEYDTHPEPTDAEIVKSAQGWHMDSRSDVNSPDIGYHFVIGGHKDETACVFFGRALSVLGTHALGNNEGNIGISVIGKFNTPNFMSQKQWDVLVNWTAKMAKDHNIDPLQNTIKKHSEFKNTDCPGTSWTNALWTQYVKNVASVKQACFP